MAVLLAPRSHEAAARPTALDPARMLDALPHPVLAVAPDGAVTDANVAAETFFAMSREAMRQHRLNQLVACGSPLLQFVQQVNESGAAFNSYRIDLTLARGGAELLVDIFVAPLPESQDGVVVMLQERSVTEKMERQLTHRGGARSVAAMASMLAHEIKNPLSGIRGAAQLLETEANDSDRALTRLICEETDRIVKLVDRMSAFSDGRPIERESVNIHAILDHVKKVAQAGFARHIRFHENYDPSLPLVFGNRDQLVQLFLNLVKNAAEAIEVGKDGDIELSTAFRPGVRMQIPGEKAPVSLPLECCVRDNGQGVPADVMPYLFDPFITTKASGSGLGLALVAKIIGDHGGVIECESAMRRTTFRVLMPMYSPPAQADGADA
ncbi:two-component system sensor histidine kinase NtrB [Methylocella silvestris]|uniref:histidine kinase n=1 Tax=Methylocella silvestris TaxID=199596 RepID=A0A2J7TDL4_METSI|nr:ATP-binding protein [Methylocella silvestris]PNG24850.1 two-component sensor histidine kinase [Methylocella silvestris]